MIKPVRRALFAAAAAVALLGQPAVAQAASPPLVPDTVVVAGDSLDNQYSAVVAYPPNSAAYELSGGANLWCVAVDGHGNLYVCNNSAVYRTPAGGGATTSVGVGSFPRDLAVNDAGDLFVTNYDVPAGLVGLYVYPAGGGAAYPIGHFDQPSRVTMDTVGDLYVTDRAGLWKIHQNGTGKKQLGGSAFAGTTGLVVNPSGVIYASDGAGGVIRVLSTTGKLKRTITGLDHPGSIAVRQGGLLVVTVANPAHIVQMQPNGTQRRTIIDHQFGDLAIFRPASTTR